MDLLARQGIQFLFILVMARLLTPSDFGRVAIASLVVAIGSVVADLGLTTSVVRERDANTDDLTTAAFLGLGGGLLTSALIMTASLLLTRSAELRDLAALTAFMAPAVLFSSAGLVPNALLVQRLDFHRLAVVGLAAATASCAAALAWALSGGGVWSLAAQPVLMALLGTAGAWLATGWWPRGGVRRASARRWLSFGRYVWGAALLDSLFSRAQILVVGGLFGSSAAGFYSRADATQQATADMAATVVGRVALPVFSTSASRLDLLLVGMRRGMRAAMTINTPVMAMIMALADPLVAVLYGDRWTPAVVLLRVLCLAGALWPLHVLVVNLLLATGRSREVFRLDLAKKMIGAAAIGLGAFWGLSGVAWGQVALGCAAVALNVVAMRGVIDYRLGDQVRDIAPSVLLAAATGLVAYLVSQWWEAPPLLEVFVLAFAGATVYLMAGLTLQLDAIRQTVELVVKRRS